MSSTHTARYPSLAGRSVFVRQNWVRRETRHPKSGKVRSVPLIDQAAKALDGLSRREHFVGPSDLVFANDTGSHLDDGDLRTRFYGALKRAGLGHKREATSLMQACIEAVKTAPAYKYRTSKRWLNEAQQFIKSSQ